jgi:hypothetical protein
MHADSNDSLENEDFGGPSQAPYFVASRKRLSRLQKNVVEEKVRGIQSELPICVAVMGKNNVVGLAGHSMLVSHNCTFNIEMSIHVILTRFVEVGMVLTF